MTLKTIQRGATLGQMVSAYNRENKTKLTVDQVAQANGIKNPDKIQAGGKLLFPDKFETNAPQQVIRNAENKKLVRNGVDERVTVNGGPNAPVTTEPAKLGTTIQSRPLENLPEPPVSKTPAKTEALVTTEPGKLGTTVQSRPLEKLPQAPVAKTEPLVTTEPGKLGTTVQSRPFEKLPEPPQKTTLSLNEFLAANKDNKLSVASLRKSGVDAASADLNGDGVVAGQAEQSKLFSIAEKADKNGDNAVADLGNAKVAKNFERIASADKLEVAPYSKKDLQRVEQTLKRGEPTRVETLSPQECRDKGLSPGSVAVTVDSGVLEQEGMGNRQNSVTVYMDAKSGQLFKEYNNDADNKNTPMVPLSASERKILADKTRTVEGRTPTENKLLDRLFGTEMSPE